MNQSILFCAAASDVLRYFQHAKTVSESHTILPPILLKFPCKDQSYAFFFPAAFALSALFRLLRIITTLKNEPTTADANRIKMTGIRIAQTRGGK